MAAAGQRVRLERFQRHRHDFDGRAVDEGPPLVWLASDDEDIEVRSVGDEDPGAAGSREDDADDVLIGRRGLEERPILSLDLVDA